MIRFEPVVACAETSRSYTKAKHLLRVQAPSTLVIVASAQGISSGINLATREYHQIPMPRVSHKTTGGTRIYTEHFLYPMCRLGRLHRRTSCASSSTNSKNCMDAAVAPHAFSDNACMMLVEDAMSSGISPMAHMAHTGLC